MICRNEKVTAVAVARWWLLSVEWLEGTSRGALRGRVADNSERRANKDRGK